MGFLFCPRQGFAGMSSKIPKSSNSPSLAVFPHGLGCSRWGESETVKITLEKLPEGPCPLLLGEFQHLLSMWVPLPKERPLETGKCSRFQPSAWEMRQPRAGSQRNSSVPNLFSPFLVEFTPLAFHCVFLFLESTIKKENCSFLYFRNSDATPCFPSSLFLECVQ